jgi:hypothetical protein
MLKHVTDERSKEPKAKGVWGGIVTLFSRPSALLVWLLNQSGSVLFNILLSSNGECSKTRRRRRRRQPTATTASLSFVLTHHTHPLPCTDISLTVPICNSLTVCFTALTGYLLGERVGRPWRLAAGTLLVLLGVSLCVSSPAPTHT